MPNRKTKKIIVAKARKLVAAKFPTVKGSTGACLYLTAGVISVAQEHGIKLLLQAGSCYWPRVTDDGIKSNVFGYQYNVIAAAPYAACSSQVSGALLARPRKTPEGSGPSSRLREASDIVPEINRRPSRRSHRSEGRRPRRAFPALGLRRQAFPIATVKRIFLKLS